MEKINLRTVSEILSESEMKQTGGIARGCVAIECENGDVFYAAECSHIDDFWCSDEAGGGECNPCVF